MKMAAAAFACTVILSATNAHARNHATPENGAPDSKAPGSETPGSETPGSRVPAGPVPADRSIAAAAITAPIPSGRDTRLREHRLPPGTYIAGATLPDTTAVLPPPPLPGSPEQADDDATFNRTRALRDTPRWALATRDADLSGSAVLADFACALGVRIDPARTPTLARLLAHGMADMSPEIDRAKQHWKRPRPFAGNNDPICVPRSPGLVVSPAYPSGHTILMFGAAEILAEVAPDRAGPIMQRGRTLSESRIVCGVHWLSDVQSGFIEAATLVAALNGSAAFHADLETARTELAALRQSGGAAPDANECRIEADAAANSPLFQTPPATR